MDRHILHAMSALAAGAFLAAGTALAQPNPDFWVSNLSERRISRLFVSPIEQETWGRDWLGDHVLLPGHRFAIRPARDGRCLYDIRVIYEDGTEEERRRQNVCAINEVAFRGARAAARGASPGATPGASPAASPGAPADRGNPDVRLVNRTGRTILQIFVSAATDRSWGEDRLGRHVLPPGHSLAITMPKDGTCLFDVRVVYDNGTAAEKRRVNTCAIGEVVFP